MNRQGQRRRAVPPTWLLPISRSTMAAAFLENGQARTLWLSGVHRRSATKADAKILAGQDLDYSLDPFDDQSFYRSAARSRNAALEVTVGVSPKASRVWLGKENSIEGFAASAALLINAGTDDVAHFHCAFGHHAIVNDCVTDLARVLHFEARLADAQ